MSDTRKSDHGHQLLYHRGEEQRDEHTVSLDSLQRIPRRQTTGPCPLSFAQERLWFLDQYEPNSPLYNVPVRVKLRGQLDVGALRESLTSLVARHESLRTTFEAPDGNPLQIIHDVQPFEIQIVDLRNFPSETRRTEFVRLASQLERLPFNLTRDFMIRATLVRSKNEEYDLLLSVHHIAFDGWSIGVFFRELTEYYRAYSTNTTPDLPDLPIQYADFAVWQRQWLQGSILEGELAYWTNQLAGNLKFEQFPIDHVRPARPTYQGRRELLYLPARLTELLKDLGRREGASLFMVLLTGLQVLLHRYTGNEDVLIGSVIANRNRLELEGLIGFFVNTIVLRADISDNPSFREMLTRVRATALDSYDHQDLPFERLVQELRPERASTHAPLCQVVIAYEDDPPAAVELPGLSLSITDEEQDLNMAKFDLTVFVEWREGLRIRCTYNADVFEASSIRRMLRHYQRLLEAVAENPTQLVGAIPLLTERDRDRLLVEWNSSQREYPELCVHELFEMQVARTPNALALVYEDDRLSYYELNQRATRLAHHLRSLGVGLEVKVGICLDRSPEAIVSLLAVLKAGGAYVPLDPAYPRERLSFMIKDAGATAVLTSARLLEKLPDEEVTLVCLDSLPAGDTLEELPNDFPGAKPDNLAYVIYTSGSTGEPKGVEICHRGIVRLLIGAQYARFGSQEVFLQLAPLSFDAATFEIWGALLHGATLVLFPNQTPTAQDLFEVLERGNVTTLWLTSSLFNAIVDEMPAALSSVRQLLVGGEALSATHVRRALSALPETHIINGYGPTESTTFTCCYSIPRNVEDTVTSIPIGRPISNTRVYILNEQLLPVPIGGIGELHIGGDGLARGYLNHPHLTSEKFIGDPFSKRPSDRLYKTGDLARYLPDGNIEFKGRLDDQVKIRGYRIEPGEIEVALTRHPGVKSAAVVPREIHSAEKQLVAYVVPKETHVITAEGLRIFLKQQLPRYMIPARFTFVASLPLTPHGKVDRRALPPPEAVGVVTHRAIVAPRNELESKILRVWQAILGIEDISVTDDFFDLGGHSLLAVRMLSRVEKACGVAIPLATLFARATIEHLAEVPSSTSRKNAKSPIVEVQAGGSKPPFFFLHGDYEGGGFYCRKLAEQMGKDQPFYAVQPHGYEGERIPRTIEAMAADRLRELLDLRPAGPYLIGGFCHGGMIAFEMARQMKELGLNVDLLVIVDASAENIRFRWLRSLAKYFGFVFRLNHEEQLDWLIRFRNLILGLRKRSKEGRRAQLALIASKIKHYFSVRLARTGKHSQPDSGSTGMVQSAEEKFLLLCDAVHAYIPGFYQGRLTLLPTDSMRSERSKDRTFGWRSVASEVVIHEIPGNHRTIVKGHVEDLAESLNRCIRSCHLGCDGLHSDSEQAVQGDKA